MHDHWNCLKLKMHLKCDQCDDSFALGNWLKIHIIIGTSFGNLSNCHFQGVSKLGGRLSGMASGVMSSIQVDIYNFKNS